MHTTAPTPNATQIAQQLRSAHESAREALFVAAARVMNYHAARASARQEVERLAAELSRTEPSPALQ